MFSQKNKKPKTLTITDSDLKEPFSSTKGMYNFRVNILGQEKGCEHKFKLLPVPGPLFNSEQLRCEQVKQRYLPDCSFFAVIRSIVRIYPDSLKAIIREVDDKWYVVSFFENNTISLTRKHYQFEKTKLASASKLSAMMRFFSKTHPETAWIKLLEKALISRMMTQSYSATLTILQEKLKNKVPTYYDMCTLIGNNELYTTLLGCKIEILFYENDSLRNDMTNELKARLGSGELMRTAFKKNKLGLYTDHSYEIVDVISKGQNDFVILSNPWGVTDVTDLLLPTVKHKLSDFESARGIDLNTLTRDKSLLIITMKTFEKYSLTTTCTKDAKAKVASLQCDVVRTVGLPSRF